MLHCDPFQDAVFKNASANTDWSAPYTDISKIL